VKPDEQDKGLGLDQVHIELNDQRNSTYGGVATGALNTSYLEIFLNNRGSGNVGATRISVRFDLPAERFTQLREVVSKLFQGHQRFKIIA
jgi:hypothetical protein